MAALHINQEQFESLIRDSEPVLVDFWAPWCSYCRKISDAYDSIADQYGDKLRVVKINIDDAPELTAAQGIELIPTLRLYQNGQTLGSVVAPESRAAIEKFIGETMPVAKREGDEHVYDMLIVGGGPGGYTAAMYAARAGLDALVLEKLSAGGQMALTHQIDNYPGFHEGIDGYRLAEQMKSQAERFGAKTAYAEVLNLDLTAEPKLVETSEGSFRGKTVVLATGANPRKLGLADEDALVGRGVAYCAACDGMFFKGKTVVVVGGGNTAVADALLLSRVARKVILVHRRDALRATKVYHDPLLRAENVEFRWNSVVEELLHDEKLTGLRLRDVNSGEQSVVDCDGVFVSVGRIPASDMLRGQLNLDSSGYVLAGEDTQTNVPGVYAVGDLRAKPLRQVVTAVSDGATAVHMAEEYLAQL